MKIVIEIDEETYKDIKDGKVYSSVRDVPQESILAISNGTPLPKGHGRLVDISKIDDDRIESDNPIIYLTINGEYVEAISLDYLDDLPTIVPEDKDVENDE